MPADLYRQKFILWQRSHIYRMLNNCTYIGKVKYKDVVCKGNIKSNSDNFKETLQA